MVKKRLLFLVSILALIIVAALYLGHICAIPPTSATVTAITDCAVRTQLFYQSNDALPSSLRSLPKRKGYANAIVDGYGRELIFEVRADRLVFISYGKDGVPGGTDENADIEVHYMTHKPDGSFWIGEPNWIVEAERRIRRPHVQE